MTKHYPVLFYFLFVVQILPQFFALTKKSEEIIEFPDPILLNYPKKYGFNEDDCPDGSVPQKTKDENIIWCQSDNECKYSFKCTSIPGLKHFGTQIKYCCATRSSACSLPPQPGYGDCGKKPKTMYYFNSFALQCMPFKVLECQGINANRFERLQDCRQRCETTACEIGESPLFENNDLDKPKLCHNKQKCPQGYTCRYDKLFRRHICCGYKNTGSCAAGLKPFMYPFTGLAQTCRENSIKDECPPNFVCSTNPFTRKKFCCSMEGGVCPAGQNPYIHPLTDKTIKCNPISYSGGDCPVGYSCSASVTGSQWGFCCSDAITANCPVGSSAYLDPINRLPQKCTIGVSICSFGYSCQNSDPLAIVGFCCTLGKPSEVYLGNGRRSLYSLEVEEKNKPLAQHPIKRPNDLFNIEQWRPELRLVDLQKELDHIEELSIVKNHAKSKRPINYHQLSKTSSNGPKCPSPMSPLLYMGTSLSLICQINSKTHCPAPSICTPAYNDPLHRHLCCIQPDGEDIDEMLGILPRGLLSSTSTTQNPNEFIVDGSTEVKNGDSNELETDSDFEQLSRPNNVVVLTSSDPFCPSVIENRTCYPGSTEICIEDSFFCQFNIQFQNFMCCSFEKKIELN